MGTPMKMFIPSDEMIDTIPHEDCRRKCDELFLRKIQPLYEAMARLDYRKEYVSFWRRRLRNWLFWLSIVLLSYFKWLK